MTVNAGEWYGNFIDILKKNELYDVINAANYMDIEPLLSLAVCKIASTVYGKTREEILLMFGRPGDTQFGDEEKKEVYIK